MVFQSHKDVEIPEEAWDVDWVVKKVIAENGDIYEACDNKCRIAEHRPDKEDDRYYYLVKTEKDTLIQIFGFISVELEQIK